MECRIKVRVGTGSANLFLRRDIIVMRKMKKMKKWKVLELKVVEIDGNNEWKFHFKNY